MGAHYYIRKPPTRVRDWLVVAGITVAGAALASPVIRLVEPGGRWLWLLIVLVLAAGSAALVLLRRRVRHVETRQDNLFAQLEAALDLRALLPLRAPLPPSRQNAAAPDFLHLIAREIHLRRPRLVVECGSGVSTLIIAYCLEQAGPDGRVLSLEQDAGYARETRRWLEAHGLAERARVEDAPLVRLAGEDEWYDYDPSGLVTPIDLLVIDGPGSPRGERRSLRAPALPVLRARLSERCVILVDDAHRATERAAVRGWTEADPKLRAEYLNLEKGAYRLYLGGDADR